MLTDAELATLESLLVRARAAAGQARYESGGTINVGDLVQLRPGADPHWQTSLLLVCQIRDDGRVSGIVLRPHRSGSREAWYTYSLPEVLRIGRAPFPPPGEAVNNASYPAQCPRCLGRDGAVLPAAGGQQDGVQIGQRLWVMPAYSLPKAKPKPATVKKAQAMVTVIEAIAGDRWRWKGHLPEICARLDATGVSHPKKWPSWSGQLTATLPGAANLVLNIAHHIEVYEDLQDGAAAIPEPKPIQRETGEIAALQIGQRLWVLPA